MTLQQRISNLSELGHQLKNSDFAILGNKIHEAKAKNPWLTVQNIKQSLIAICDHFLDKQKLEAWTAHYDISDHLSGKIIGIVMAGNLPLVGFHDLLCSYITGHKTMYKMSSKDDVLLPAVLDVFCEIDPLNKELFTSVERLKGYDAVIATGGDTAAVHFEYYFRNYPHIIRKNRNSIAILDGTETKEDLVSLGRDVFDYFGLGCRSVSKIYIPKDFNTDKIFEAFYTFGEIIHHNKYKNNYDYNNATLILTKQKFLTNDFIILREDTTIGSRIATLHYERYQDIQTVKSHLKEQMDDIQCIASKDPIDGIEYIALGSCQQPGLSDYADHVDTVNFLSQLS